MIVSVSIRRADYWLVEVLERGLLPPSPCVSIRRADYWLVEVGYNDRKGLVSDMCFNPPGGLLVG